MVSRGCRGERAGMRQPPRVFRCACSAGNLAQPGAGITRACRMPHACECSWGQDAVARKAWLWSADAAFILAEKAFKGTLWVAETASLFRIWQIIHTKTATPRCTGQCPGRQGRLVCRFPPTPQHPLALLGPLISPVFRRRKTGLALQHRGRRRVRCQIHDQGNPNRPSIFALNSSTSEPPTPCKRNPKASES